MDFTVDAAELPGIEKRLDKLKKLSGFVSGSRGEFKTTPSNKSTTKT